MGGIRDRLGKGEICSEVWGCQWSPPLGEGGGGRGEGGGGRGEKPLLASSPVKNCEISDCAAKIYARIFILLDPACQELRD